MGIRRKDKAEVIRDVQTVVDNAVYDFEILANDLNTAVYSNTEDILNIPLSEVVQSFDDAVSCIQEAKETWDEYTDGCDLYEGYRGKYRGSCRRLHESYQNDTTDDVEDILSTAEDNNGCYSAEIYGIREDIKLFNKELILNDPDLDDVLQGIEDLYDCAQTTLYDALWNFRWFTQNYSEDKLEESYLRESTEIVITPQSNVKKVYKRLYKNDYCIDQIDPSITVQDVFDILDAGEESIYDYLPPDSVVRERVFDFVSDALGIDYDVLYYLWLGKRERAYKLL